MRGEQRDAVGGKEECGQVGRGGARPLEDGQQEQPWRERRSAELTGEDSGRCAGGLLARRPRLAERGFAYHESDGGRDGAVERNGEALCAKRGEGLREEDDRPDGSTCDQR